MNVRAQLVRDANLTVAAAALAGIAFFGGCASSGSVQPTSQAARTERCKVATEQEIASLFDRWNQSLQTGDQHAVVANYAEGSVLLPTLSNKPRLTAEEKGDYFHHFLENLPSGKIDMRVMEIGCNTATDTGLYTFTFAKTGATVSARYTFTSAGMARSGSLPAITLPLCRRSSSGGFSFGNGKCDERGAASALAALTSWARSCEPSLVESGSPPPNGEHTSGIFCRSLCARANAPGKPQNSRDSCRAKGS